MSPRECYPVGGSKTNDTIILRGRRLVQKKKRKALPIVVKDEGKSQEGKERNSQVGSKEKEHRIKSTIRNRRRK